MTIVILHIRCMDSQSVHLPVTTQGVLRPLRLACSGAMTFLMRSMASCTSLRILFRPTVMITCGAPKIVAATRFPTPSMLTTFPSSVTALQPDNNTSALRVFRVISMNALCMAGSFSWCTPTGTISLGTRPPMDASRSFPRAAVPGRSRGRACRSCGAPTETSVAFPASLSGTLWYLEFRRESFPGAAVRRCPLDGLAMFLACSRHRCLWPPSHHGFRNNLSGGVR